MSLSLLMADNLYFHLIILLAGFTQGFTGFGSALVMLPLLSLLMNVKIVVPLVILLGFVINVLLLPQVFRHICWTRIVKLLIATVPGIFCGVYILVVMSTGFIELIIGALLTAFPLYLLSKGVPERETSAWWVWPVGFFSGLLSGSVGAGGPPVIIYTALQPWDKMVIKSVLVGFFLFTSVTAIFAQGLSGIISTRVIMLFVSGLPALVTGVMAGSCLFGRFDSQAYRKLLCVLLVALGVVMMVKSAVGDW